MATPESPPPQTTKAWTFSRGGPPRTGLTLTPSHPLPPFPPPPGQDEEETLLLSISHAALNPGELIFMINMPLLVRSPAARQATVPGYDLVGTVLDVHAPSRFQKGDEVVGFITFDHIRSTGVGALQGRVVVPAKYAVKIPAGKTRREAVGLLLTGCTALKQVEEAGVGRGMRVLVVGASGGIGTAATQVVREKVGVEGVVVAVCSGRGRGVVEGLGVDEVVDYTEHPDLAGELTRRYGDKPFDVVVDTFGNQALFQRCAGFLKEDGVYEASGVHFDAYATWPLLVSGLTMMWNALRPKSPWLGGTGRTWRAVSMMDPGLEFMERVVAMFGEGKLKVVTDSEWGFDEVHEAYDVLLSGRAKGKIIIRVDGE